MSKINVNQLVEKWNPLINEEKVVAKVGKIKDNKIETMTAIMLENEFNYLKEQNMVNEASYTDGSFGSNYATSGEFHKIAIPMVRRTFPNLIAHETVGVQPMTSPVGLAFALRFRAGQTYNSGSNTELGYNTVDKSYTGSMVTSAGEILGSSTSPAVGLGIGTGDQIKEVNLTIEKAQIEAKTRKLRSRWSLEVAQDLNAMHGLDIESEMLDILGYEIQAEIDREIIDAVKTAANTNAYSYVDGQLGTLSWASSAHFDGRWEHEKYRNLYNRTVRMANRIAITTRRGAGNFVVANPTVCAALEGTSSFTIAPVSGNVNTANTSVEIIGTLDGRMKVIRDTFATVDELTVGYKGAGGSGMDAGIIYCPFIQLLLSRATFENSFNPTIGLMSRYALHSNIFGAENYYIRSVITEMP
jgi:hypothetical protein